MKLRLVGVALVLAVVLGACSRQAKQGNFQPPELGVPATAADVTGIYRSIHKGLLQLRANGELNLVIQTSFGATSGTFTLQNGDATVRTANCGNQVGAYRLQVVAGPIVSKSTILFEAVSDPCADRLHYLTIDPWVYADS